MKDSSITPRTYPDNDNKTLATEFQKNCISDISELCQKKNRSKKRRRLFRCLSVIFCFVSVFLLTVVFSMKLILGKDRHTYSVFSALSALVSLFFGAKSRYESKIEKLYGDEIHIFEDVIQLSERLR